jgi:hypothetical protein
MADEKSFSASRTERSHRSTQPFFPAPGNGVASDYEPGHSPLRGTTFPFRQRGGKQLSQATAKAVVRREPPVHRLSCPAVWPTVLTTPVIPADWIHYRRHPDCNTVHP